VLNQIPGSCLYVVARLLKCSGTIQLIIA
jgi:hypothetical protein